jgi:hypothetical protein
MFGELYRLCERYWKPTEEDRADQGFWDRMVSEFMEWVNKYSEYGDDTLVRLAAVIITRAEDITRDNCPICGVNQFKLVAAMLKAVS